MLSYEVKSFKQTVSVSTGTMCSVKSYNKCSKCSLSALTQAHNCFAIRLIIAQSIGLIRCSKSAQKFDVRVCQIATVVMETAQPVLSQFKNF